MTLAFNCPLCNASLEINATNEPDLCSSRCNGCRTDFEIVITDLLVKTYTYAVYPWKIYGRERLMSRGGNDAVSELLNRHIPKTGMSFQKQHH